MRGLIRHPTSKLTEEQWQKLRHTFVISGKVGGSDAGTLLGVNKYKSPINLFYQAVGIATLPNKMNAAMLHGKQLEDYVAKQWQYFDGTDEGWVNNVLNNNKIKKYRKLKAIIENPKYPHLFANVDGIITHHPEKEGRGVLEIKTISGYSADAYEEGIPPSYFVQVQLYMLVCGLPYGEIAYMKDGRDLGVKPVEADPDLQQIILDAAQEHYDRVLKARKAIMDYQDSGAWSGDLEELYGIAQNFEPEPDCTEAFKVFISERHKQRENEVVLLGDTSDADNADAYQGFKDQIKELEEKKQLHENRLRARMQHAGAAVLTMPNGKVTWRKQFLVKLS